MKRINSALILMLLLALAGCVAGGAGQDGPAGQVGSASQAGQGREARVASGIDPSNAEAVFQATTQSFDASAGEWQTLGPTITPNPAHRSSYFLRAFHRDQHPRDWERVRLHFVLSLADWWFVDRAISQGRRLKLLEIARDDANCATAGCQVMEQVAISMTVEDFRKRAQAGSFTGKLAGERGAMGFAIPGAYLAGFARRLDGGLVSAGMPAPPPVLAPAKPPVLAPAQPPVLAPAKPPVLAPAKPTVLAPAKPPVLAPAKPPILVPALQRPSAKPARRYQGRGVDGCGEPFTLVLDLADGRVSGELARGNLAYRVSGDYQVSTGIGDGRMGKIRSNLGKLGARLITYSFSGAGTQQIVGEYAVDGSQGPACVTAFRLG